MKIAILTTSISGGAGIAALRHSSLLSKAGYEITLFTKEDYSLFGRLLAKFYYEVELLFKKLFVKSIYLSTINFSSATNWAKKLESFDIVFVHWVQDSFLSHRDLSKIKNSNKSIKIFLYMHDEWYVNSIFHYSHKRDKISWAVKEIINRYAKSKFNSIKRNVDGIISPTNYLLSLVKYIYPNINSYKIENPIDFSWIKVKKGARDIDIVFFASDIKDQRKGFNYFLEVLDNLKHLRLKVWVIGSSGNDFNIGLINVKYLGFVSNHKIGDFLKRCKVMINCSSADNYPNVILESLYYNVEVVSFDVGGIKEVLLDSKLTVEFGDVTSLSALTANILNNYEEPNYTDRLNERNHHCIIDKYKKII